MTADPMPPNPPDTTRDALLDRALARSTRWDVLVIGGGATGLGIALDAASRGYRTLLLEKRDFSAGTSSRSTKLVHGGVRYLKQGQIGLVREALSERELLRRNAPRCVAPMQFLVPAYSRWEKLFYATGLKAYDLLAGRSSFPDTRVLSRDDAIARVPGIEAARLRGGVVYSDGQFDDARLAIALARTASRFGAVVLNYVEVVSLLVRNRQVVGAALLDRETGRSAEVEAKVVINATGVGVDVIRRMSRPDASPLVRPSRGTHLMLPGGFLGGDTAVMVPKTPDGRVIFAVPWLGHALVGTTDVPIESDPDEPTATGDELSFLLETVRRYLSRKPTLADVTSCWAGIRPLVREGAEATTARLSREHLIEVADDGLVTITGGKWTTYRRMAEDALNRAAEVARLETRPCRTESIALDDEPLASIDAAAVPSDETVARLVSDTWARTVEDVLSRRSRLLLLDASRAEAASRGVADAMARAMGKDTGWEQRQAEQFNALARRYRPADLR